MESVKPLVSICIPHWQVKELITVCLRAIRKFTPADISYEIIVVDNGSQDDSLDYLRSLKGIHLIERGTQTPEHWVTAFMTALDVGFQSSRGDYFVIMHTDTLIKHPDWLYRLLAPVLDEPQCAAVGAWKLEKPQPFYEFFKKYTDVKKLKLWFHAVILRNPKAQTKRVPHEICPRDYCALYRSEPIRRYNLKFCPVDSRYRYTAAERMYQQLKEHGYHAQVLDTGEMMTYMEHLAHATAGLRPDQRHLNHRRAQKKSERKIQAFFNNPMVRELVQDHALDR